MEYTFSRENFAILQAQNIELMAIISKLQKNACDFKKALETSQNDLENSQKLIDCLREKIDLMQQRRFGKKTEANLPKQYVLFDAPESVEIKPAITTTKVLAHERKKSEGRRIDVSKLLRERVVHDLADEDKHCKCCGNALEKIGEDTSEQLKYIPAKVMVIEHVCPKYTCRNCETITTQKKPETPIAKCMAGAELLAAVIIAKYDAHLPLYRQAKMLLQDGIDIPANTLGNWIMQCGEILEPLGEAFWKQLLQTNILQADETPVTLLSNDKQGYMWAYHSLKPENKFIVFEYSNSRSQETVNKRLAEYKGFLQTDGYQGYNQMRFKEGVISIGCFAHCRRHFAEIIKTGIVGKANEAVDYIGQLYAIESDARDKKLDFVQRKELRQQKAEPILRELKQWLDKTMPETPPQSALGKAISYALNQWQYLSAYVSHGEVEIDNNLVENKIRPFALGRKNWLFIGNEKAANIAALLYSLIQTAKLHDIHPRDYLIHVLNQAGKMRRQEIDPASLLPQFIDKKLFS